MATGFIKSPFLATTIVGIPIQMVLTLTIELVRANLMAMTSQLGINALADNETD